MGFDDYSLKGINDLSFITIISIRFIILRQCFMKITWPKYGNHKKYQYEYGNNQIYFGFLWISLICSIL
jgi:hypothetical protein